MTVSSQESRLSVIHSPTMRGRERERERERERDIHTQKDTHIYTHGGRQADRQTDTSRDRERKKKYIYTNVFEFWIISRLSQVSRNTHRRRFLYHIGPSHSTRSKINHDGTGTRQPIWQSSPVLWWPQFEGRLTAQEQIKQISVCSQLLKLMVPVFLDWNCIRVGWVKIACC